MKKRGNEKKRSLKGGALTSSLFGTVGGIAVLLLIISIFSAISLFFENPHAYVSPLSYFAIYGAAFLGGFIAVKKNCGRDALLCGLLCGIFSAVSLSLIFLIVGLVLKSESTAATWIFRALTIIFPILGALLGMKRRAKPKKRKKRR